MSSFQENSKITKHENKISIFSVDPYEYLKNGGY